MAKLLKFKHWQLFLLLMIFPLVFEFIVIGLVAANKNPELAFVLVPVMIILFMGLFFSWIYSLGTHLHKKLPETASMKLTRFKIFLLVPVAYMLFLSVFLFNLFSVIAGGGQPNPAIFAFILPLHLFSIFCIFYCFYFNAKALKAVELQKPVTFSDFAGEFFLLWFFPIGVWIIQPRINRLFDPSAGSNDDNNSQALDANI